MPWVIGSVWPEEEVSSDGPGNPERHFHMCGRRHMGIVSLGFGLSFTKARRDGDADQSLRVVS